MFKIDDTVIYGMNGVCKIEDIAIKDFGESKKEYYVLKPINNMVSTLYVPTHNEKALAKLKRVLSEQEVYRLIEEMPKQECIWFEKNNERKEQYKQIIEKGDHKELIGMLKAIYLQKKKREAEGKRLHLSDDRYFKEAEKMLYDEFQYVLNIKREELIPFIFSKIAENL